MPRLVDDHALRAAFKRGEREALATVYREYVGPLYQLVGRGFAFESQGRRYAFKGQQAAWAVEDTLQNVFIRAFAEPTRQAYDGLRPYRNYLFSIAKNLIIDEHRARWREHFVADPVGDSHTDADVPCIAQRPRTPDELLHDRQVQEQVAQFVAALRPDERALFVVRFQEGQSVEYCARHLQVSEHYVKSREKRLKQRFFDQMQRGGYFEGYQFGDPNAAALVVLLLTMGGGACA